MMPGERVTEILTPALSSTGEATWSELSYICEPYFPHLGNQTILSIACFED